jgi:mono/diheme cytochrome c family protein
MRGHLAALACAALLAGCTGSTPKGDPDRGAKLHEACLDCHGTGLYTSPERKIKSLEALRRDVVRWGDYYNPAFTEQDVDDVTAFLNRDYYKFH